MTFKEYYAYYLTLHTHKWCKRLHVLGQMVTILYIGLVIKSHIWWLLCFAPFVIYPFAWAGHFIFEKNKPAAFSRPLWAKACDWVMLKDIITRKIKL